MIRSLKWTVRKHLAHRKSFFLTSFISNCLRNNQEHDSLYFPAIIFPSNCGCSYYISKWLFSEVVWKGVSFCQVQIDCLSVSLNITLFLHCKKRWIESPISFPYSMSYRTSSHLSPLSWFIDFFRQRTVQPHFGQMFLNTALGQYLTYSKNKMFSLI